MKPEETMDAFDEAMQEDSTKSRDPEWTDEEDAMTGGEGDKPAPDVSVVIAAPATDAKPEEDTAPVEAPAESAEAAPEAEPMVLPSEETPAMEAAEDDTAYRDAALSITEDFGEDFMGKFETIIAHHVSKALMGGVPGGDVNARINGLIADIQDGFRNMHGDALRAIQEDVDEVAESPEFRSYIDGMPEEEKAKALAIIENGRLPMVVKLLREFKKSRETVSDGADPFDDIPDDLDGVKSSPSVPATISGDNPDDYEEGWDEDVTRRGRR